MTELEELRQPIVACEAQPGEAAAFPSDKKVARFAVTEAQHMLYLQEAKAQLEEAGWKEKANKVLAPHI